VVRCFEPDDPWSFAFRIDTLDFPIDHWLYVLRAVDHREPAIGVDYDGTLDALNVIANDLHSQWRSET